MKNPRCMRVIEFARIFVREIVCYFIRKENIPVAERIQTILRKQLLRTFKKYLARK